MIPKLCYHWLKYTDKVEILTVQFIAGGKPNGLNLRGSQEFEMPCLL